MWPPGRLRHGAEWSTSPSKTSSMRSAAESSPPRLVDRPLASDVRAALDPQRARVIGPDDPSYAVERLTYNRLHDPYPLAIVQTLDAKAVAAVLRIVVDADLPLAVRGGGHHIAGFGSCDGGVVLDFSPFRDVHVNPAEGTVE